MKHPLWILNGTLFGLIIVTLFFVLFSRKEEPVLEDIEPTVPATTVKRKASEINIKKIYEYDLFDTYRPEALEIKKPELLTPFPQPPIPQKAKTPQEPRPQFLDPLKITLRGIISISNNYTKNRAIIADSKTNKESVYKVGDIIEDAQLIKIFNKKIILLRANGQQEVLYLREADAQADPAYLAAGSWENIAQKVSTNNYTISTSEFTRHIRNLAQFINLLDLTTVYKKGQSIGCRIGRSAQPSFINQCGLLPEDIIVSVNDIPATNTSSRLRIYKNMLTLKEHDVVIVSLLRNSMPVTIHYTLTERSGAEMKQTKEKQALTGRPSREQVDSLRKRHSFAPTINEIRARERKNILNMNGRSLQNDRR